jgi:hypothetical protein
MQPGGNEPRADERLGNAASDPPRIMTRAQYARAKIALRVAGFPHRMQVPLPPG